jgi:hypothetical protein
VQERRERYSQWPTSTSLLDGSLEFENAVPSPLSELLFDTAFSYTCYELDNLEHPKGGIMTAVEALESLLEKVVHERTTIEDQMKNIYAIPGGFAYDRAKPDEKTQYDPSAMPTLNRDMQIETGSELQGQLHYNGQVQDHIKRLMAKAKE